MAPIKLVDRSADQVLSLSYIRTVLQRLEDTILFQLIERGQNAHNAVMYKPGAIPALQEKEGWSKSWVEWFLKETESSHSKLRRWQAPDEYPFTDIMLLPAPILPPVQYPDVLYKPAIVNVNKEIYSHYRDHLVPTLTKRHGEVSRGCRRAEKGDYTDSVPPLSRTRTQMMGSTEVLPYVTLRPWRPYRSVSISVRHPVQRLDLIVS